MPKPPANSSPRDSTKDSQVAKLQTLRKLSNLLDNAVNIPGTSYGIGIDPLLGLIPGGGDVLAGLLSIYIVFSAAKMGVSRESLLRMAYNIVFDTVAGTVPVVGDLFDVAWKANVKNMALLDAHLESPKTSKKANRLFVFLLLGGLLLFVIAISLVGMLIIALLINVIQTILQG